MRRLLADMLKNFKKSAPGLKSKIWLALHCFKYHQKYVGSLGCVPTSKNLGGISSNDFAEPSSSSLAPIMAARGVNVDDDNPRHRPGQTAGAEVAYRGLARPPCFRAPVRAMKIRQAPGALRTTQNHLQYYQQASQTLAGAVWA